MLIHSRALQCNGFNNASFGKYSRICRLHSTRPRRPALRCNGISKVAVSTTNSKRCISPLSTSTKPKENKPLLVQANKTPTRLERYFAKHPAMFDVFYKTAKFLRILTPRYMAQHRIFNIYDLLIATRADDEAEFWSKSCHLPPTFQSWFTITNLHVWLWMTRFRALPKDTAIQFTQPLVDTFFDDVEFRLRALLQPGLCLPNPKSPPTSYYPVPDQMADRQAKKRQAPERLLTRQMHNYREQYFGMGLSLDLGLARDDVDMAAAVWRNFMGCRGAQGIQLPDLTSSEPTPFIFRKAVNAFGSKTEKLMDLDDAQIAKLELVDDGSGVYDHRPEEADLYVRYPETMLSMTAYIRKETERLASFSDDMVMSKLEPGTLWDDLAEMKFGSIGTFTLDVGDAGRENEEIISSKRTDTSKVI